MKLNPRQQRIASTTTANPRIAKEIWTALTERGTLRANRAIEWPIPRFALEPGAAELQLKEGWRAEPRYDPLPLPVDWSANPHRDKAWINRLMCLQPMDAHIAEYDRTGDRMHLEIAKTHLISWITFHIRDLRTAYLSWYDMPTGYRALKLSRILTESLESNIILSPDEQLLIIHAAEVHMQELMRPENLSLGNHGIFQMHGLTVIGQMFWALPDAHAATEYARNKMLDLVHRQFDREGAHLEHSPQYHFWMMGELNKLQTSGWHTLNFDETLRKAYEVSAWLVEPDGSPIQIGDTGKNSPVPSVATRSEGDYTTKFMTTRWLANCGYAIARSRDNSGQLFLQAAYHSKAHKHADDLHFNLYDLGVSILVDGGTTGYKMDDTRAYLLSTLAHNTVTRDLKSTPRDGTDAYGSALKTVRVNEDTVELTAFVDHASQEWTHHRHISWKAGESVTVTDTVSGQGRSTYAQHFHLDPSFEMHNDEAGTYFVREGVHVRFESALCTEWVSGQTSPMNGWRADGPGRAVRNWSGTFSLAEPREQATLRTTIQFSPVTGEDIA